MPNRIVGELSDAPSLELMRRAWAIALLLAVAACACGCFTARPPVESQVRALAPALRLTFEPSAAGTPPAASDVHRFSFTSLPPHAWPYGTGFAVAARDSGEVLWIHLHNGDFAPHEVRWADFDGDGRGDIFFHAGFEDVATTHLYVNRVTSNGYAVSHFAQAYENENVYALVVDFDADGRPELMAPDRYPPEDDECRDAFDAVAAANGAWKEEYRRLSGSFDPFNFHFGVPAADYDALQLFSKPEIVSFGPGPDSAAVVRHLKLREDAIAAGMPALPEPCRGRATEVTAWLAGLIHEYETE